MNCPICGARSRVEAQLPRPLELRTEFHRTCDRGHKFVTSEVYLSQLADAREMRCAVRNIRRRIERFERDVSIAADARPVRELAEEYNLTDTRVRQIRAAMRDRDQPTEPRK